MGNINIDMRSLIIGALLSVVLGLTVAATSDKGTQVGRYDLNLEAVSDPAFNAIYVSVVDTKTGRFTVGQMMLKAPRSTWRYLGSWENPLK